MKQQLYEFLEGWRSIRVEDVCNKVTDGAHHTPKYVLDGVPFLSVKDISKGKVDFSNTRFVNQETHNQLFKRCNPEYGDLLYTKVGTTGIAKVNDTKKEFSLFVSVALLKPKNDLIKPYFFEYMLNSPDAYEQAQNKTRGVANRNLVLRDIKNIVIPLPPLNEQKRIVAKLDALFTRIDTAITHLQQTVELSKALFASALDEVFQQAYCKNPVEKLSTLTSKIGSGATPKGGQKSYKTEGISLIRSLNVHDAWFKKKGLAYIDDIQAGLLSNVEVRSGDVLLNITGASVARSCVVPDEYLPARVNQHVSILRPKGEIDTKFLNYLIISPNFKNDLLFQGAGGATRQALTKKMLQNLKIPLPSLDEQNNIVARLEALSEHSRTLETTTQEKLNDFTSLKASLLDAAFKGQL